MSHRVEVSDRGGAWVLIGDAVWVLRLIVSAVFALAAWGKLTDRTATRQAVEEFGVAARFAPVVGWALPAAELMVAVAVLPSVSAVAACCAALALLVAFTAAVVGQLRQGRRPSCSCFGVASTAPISRWTLARNAGIAVLVAATLGGSWTQGSVPRQLPADHAVALAVIVALGAVQVRQASTMRALRRQLDQTRTTPSKPEGLPVGTPAPEFDLPGIDGTRATLGELVGAGRPIALVFLHPRCAPCHGLAGELPQWHQRHHTTLTLMPIGSGELATNTAWAREHHLAQMLVQDHLEVALRYRLRGTPTAVLIDTRGRIAAAPARGPAEIRKLLTDPTTTPTRS